MGKFIKKNKKWLSWDRKNYIFAQMWRRRGHNWPQNSHYNGVGALRGQRHTVPNKLNPLPPPPSATVSQAPGGVLPYITYMGMCRPTGSWFWSSWFRTGYACQRRFPERGIIFRTLESSIFVSSHLKLFKDRLLLKIRFNALTSKLGCTLCSLERSIKNWPISRTGYQFKGEF